MVIERFIVIEGLDGNGKSSVIPHVATRLSKAGKRVRSSEEPTSGQIGTVIRAILHNRSPIPTNALPSLFAADRYQHLFDKKNGVIPYLQQADTWEICSRYIYSSLAYQSLTEKYAFIRHLNRHFPLPHFLFYIDLTPEECWQRIGTRVDKDRLERLDILQRVHRYYRRIIAEARRSETMVHTIDGTQHIDQIAEAIFTILTPYL